MFRPTESLRFTDSQGVVDAESGVVGAGNKRHSLLYIKKSIADASRLFEVETGYWNLSRYKYWYTIYLRNSNSWFQCKVIKSQPKHL
mmetsp:Transcript_2729/g.5857  ORF Transcript_2729/g.5857 Transcript_2729/m.5857 type:complete len:87 (-) Transcript_2729:259-519(-)